MQGGVLGRLFNEVAPSIHQPCRVGYDPWLADGRYANVPVAIIMDALFSRHVKIFLFCFWNKYLDGNKINRKVQFALGGLNF